MIVRWCILCFGGVDDGIRGGQLGGGGGVFGFNLDLCMCCVFSAFGGFSLFVFMLEVAES